MGKNKRAVNWIVVGSKTMNSKLTKKRVKVRSDDKDWFGPCQWIKGWLGRSKSQTLCYSTFGTKWRMWIG